MIPISLGAGDAAGPIVGINFAPASEEPVHLNFARPHPDGSIQFSGHPGFGHDPGDR